MSATTSKVLGHALGRTPPHLVLLLGESSADLYQARGDSLTPLEEGFPVERGRAAAWSPDAAEDLLVFLDRVDETFGRVRALHPSPMVLAGPESLVTAFGDRSDNLYRLAGVVTGRATETPDGLYDAARAAVEPYLLSREAEALWTLEHAHSSRPEHVATGLEACSAAAQRGRPVMLVAEEGLAGAERGVVEGLIESVIDQGGWVALAHNGLLGREGRVAMVFEPGPGARDE